jgi:RecA-family ATPase
MAIDEALSYISRGWSIIPLKGPKSVKPKSPALKSWEGYQKKKPSISLVNDWFGGKYPDLGVGVVCGPISGIVVLDIDGQDGVITVEETVEFVKDRYGVDITAPNVVWTGGGGYHVYYRLRNEQIKNRVKFAPGLDFRAEGGYVAAPGTLHESGRPYFWATGEMPDTFPDIPEALVADLQNFSNTKTVIGEVIDQGGRDDALTKKVGKLFKLGMSYDDVKATAVALNKTYCNPPLDARSVARIVDSIHKRETGKEQPTAKSQEFELKSFSHMLDKYADLEEEWIIKDWFPTSTCALVTSAPGTYKTWILLDLAIAVATGNKFLGLYDVLKTGPVVVVQQEDPFPMLVRRSSQIMNVGDVEEVEDYFEIPMPPDIPNLYFHTEKSLQFDDKEVMASFSRMIDRVRPALVIIDPLYSAAKADDFMVAAAQNMLILKKLRDTYSTSFFIAHHSTKGGGGEGRARDKAWGSQFLNAWLETGIQLQETDSPGEIQVTRHFKNSEMPAELLVKFNITSGNFVVDVEEYTKKQPKKGSKDEELEHDIEERLRSLIESGGTESIQQMCERLGVKSKSTMSKHLKNIGAAKVGDRYRIIEIS